MTIYFAYGSNLNRDQMARRCPDAVPLDSLELPGARLVFRGVADVVFEDGATCPGGLWQITPACEAELDRYEGFQPDGGGMYRKVYVPVEGLPDGETEVMLYVMNSTGIMPPAVWYYNAIAEGYEDFGLSPIELRKALKHSHDAKRPTHVERKRMRRNGRPALKARPGKPVPDAKPAKPGKKAKNLLAKRVPYEPRSVEQERKNLMSSWLADWRRSQN